MDAPKQTAAIFDILSRGQFISANSSDDNIRKLYAVIEDEQKFNFFYDYFANINFTLEAGDQYFYFAREETKVDLERKLEQAFKWIDIVDFLKTFNNSFSAGYRFTASEIEVQLKIDAELKSKITGLKKYTLNKDKYSDIIAKILDDLKKDRFIELENTITEQYKVLNSFVYLEDLISLINITEQGQDEIPE